MKYESHFSNQHQKLYHISKALPNTFFDVHPNCYSLSCMYNNYQLIGYFTRHQTKDQTYLDWMQNWARWRFAAALTASTAAELEIRSHTC